MSSGVPRTNSTYTRTTPRSTALAESEASPAAMPRTSASTAATALTCRVITTPCASSGAAYSTTFQSKITRPARGWLPAG